MVIPPSWPPPRHLPQQPPADGVGAIGGGQLGWIDGDPAELATTYGTDAVRWWLLREVPRWWPARRDHHRSSRAGHHLWHRRRPLVAGRVVAEPKRGDVV